MERFLKPRQDGMICRDPITMIALSQDGEWKSFIGPSGRYWRRRVNCGDCLDITEQKLQENKKRVKE